MLVAVWIAVALVVAVGLVRGAGAWRWRRATHRLVTRLGTAGPPAEGAPVAEPLPEPVRRWLARQGGAAQRPIAAATLVHDGTFDLGPAQPKWRPFTSRQRVVTSPPGFVWDARIRAVPGLPVHVYDAFVAGEGQLRASLAGLLPLAQQTGGGAFGEGELMRFLAEAVWYPTFLLPGGAVHWSPIDSRWARAELHCGAIHAALDFRVDDRGDIDTVRAAARGRTVGDRLEPTPWLGRFWDHAERHGLRIPLAGEVGWVLPDGWRPYWRGRIRRVDYEFA